MVLIPNDKILHRKTIILTYPKQEYDDCFNILSAAGANVLSMPVIATGRLPFRLNDKIENYRWLVFTSKNAALPLLDQYMPVEANKIAAIGQGTTDELKRYGCEVHFTGKGISAGNFANELLSILMPEDRVLLVLGSMAPNLLESKLSDICSVERINVYQTIMPDDIDLNVLDAVRNNLYDALIVSSPSAIKNLMTLFPENQCNLKVVSIGQTTTAAVREFGIEPLATAINPGYKELAETTINYFTNI